MFFSEDETQSIASEAEASRCCFISPMLNIRPVTFTVTRVRFDDLTSIIPAHRREHPDSGTDRRVAFKKCREESGSEEEDGPEPSSSPAVVR